MPGVLAVADGSNLTLVNSGTGVTLFNNSNKFYGSPSISNGVLYVGSLTGQLLRFLFDSPFVLAFVCPDQACPRES